MGQVTRRDPGALPLRLTACAEGPAGLWVLDEGHPDAAYVGNKLRKLVDILRVAREQGVTDLLTYGAVGSHHVLATAVHGAALGLRTHAVLIPQPDHPHVRRQALRNMAALSSWEAVRLVAAVPLASARLVARVVTRHGRRPFVIPPGGSSVVGTTGWVVAGRALAAQRPGATVVVASGSGGTAAGLFAGGCRVVAVRVGPRALTHRARLVRLGRRAARRAGVASEGSLVVDGSYLAGGYGRTDQRTERALAWGRAQGWPMEPTYTAKALAAALDRVARGEVVFVQTASGVAPPVPDKVLPAAIESLLVG